MSPGTAVSDIKVISPGLCLETRRAVCRNAVAEPTFGAAEFAGPINLLGEIFIAPDAFD